MSRGGGAISSSASAVTMPCGTNQSDDLHRDAAYSLPATAPYGHLHLAVRGAAAGGSDELLTVALKSTTTYANAPQTLPVVTVRLRPGEVIAQDAQLPPGAQDLQITLVCVRPGGSVDLAGTTLSP